MVNDNKTLRDIFNVRELNDIALKHLDSLFAQTRKKLHISADALCQAMQTVRQILLIEATEARAPSLRRPAPARSVGGISAAAK